MMLRTSGRRSATRLNLYSGRRLEAVETLQDTQGIVAAAPALDGRA